MDLEDAGCQVKYLIRDRDGKYPALFDTVLADAGITVVRSGVRMPRMNSLMERWIQACRHELLDRTLIWNHTHLVHALREYEHHHNHHPGTGERGQQMRRRPVAGPRTPAGLAVHRDLRQPRPMPVTRAGTPTPLASARPVSDPGQEQRDRRVHRLVDAVGPR
jgi:hypothetical protein